MNLREYLSQAQGVSVPISYFAHNQNAVDDVLAMLHGSPPSQDVYWHPNHENCMHMLVSVVEQPNGTSLLMTDVPTCTPIVHIPPGISREQLESSVPPPYFEGPEWDQYRSKPSEFEGDPEFEAFLERRNCPF